MLRNVLVVDDTGPQLILLFEPKIMKCRGSRLGSSKADVKLRPRTTAGSDRVIWMPYWELCELNMMYVVFGLPSTAKLGIAPFSERREAVERRRLPPPLDPDPDPLPVNGGLHCEAALVLPLEDAHGAVEEPLC